MPLLISWLKKTISYLENIFKLYNKRSKSLFIKKQLIYIRYLLPNGNLVSVNNRSTINSSQPRTMYHPIDPQIPPNHYFHLSTVYNHLDMNNLRGILTTINKNLVFYFYLRLINQLQIFPKQFDGSNWKIFN